MRSTGTPKVRNAKFNYFSLLNTFFLLIPIISLNFSGSENANLEQRPSMQVPPPGFGFHNLIPNASWNSCCKMILASATDVLFSSLKNEKWLQLLDYYNMVPISDYSFWITITMCQSVITASGLLLNLPSCLMILECTISVAFEEPVQATKPNMKWGKAIS